MIAFLQLENSIHICLFGWVVFFGVVFFGFLFVYSCPLSCPAEPHPGNSLQEACSMLDLMENLPPV